MWTFSREKKGFEIAKVNSRCFCWFPAPMLVPIRRGTNMASHTKLCNFPWYIFSNNSIMRYRTALWLSHVVYVSLFYNISISWLYLLNGWGFYFFTCVTMCEVKTTNRRLSSNQTTFFRCISSTEVLWRWFLSTRSRLYLTPWGKEDSLERSVWSSVVPEQPQ